MEGEADPVQAGLENSLSSEMETEKATDGDVDIHKGIIDSFFDGLMTSAIEHVQELKSRLIQEKEDQLRVQNEYYTNRVTDLSNQLDHMTDRCHEYEQKCSTLKESMFQRLDNLSLLYELSYKMYVSEYSVKQIFITWKLNVLKRRKYNRLSSMVKHILNKRKVSKIFHRMHKSTMRAAFERKEKEHNLQVGNLAKQVIPILSTFINCTCRPSRPTRLSC